MILVEVLGVGSWSKLGIGRSPLRDPSCVMGDFSWNLDHNKVDFGRFTWRYGPCGNFSVVCRHDRSQRRFNLHAGTVYKAVNYIDRFININRCNGWEYWMMELLSLACLSIASKFHESAGRPSLHKIQEGLEHCFDTILIKKMEMKILESLGWVLNSITAHSYVELVVWELNSLLKPSILNELSSTLNDFILASSLDDKVLVYRPCVVVVSGLRCILDNFLPKTHEECLSHITSHIPPNQTKNLPTCYEQMQQILVSFRKSANANPSSLETALTKGQIAIYEDQVDLSFLGTINKNLKRKRE